MGVGGPYVCAGRVVLGSRPRDRPRRPRWAVEGYAGDDQRDTEKLQAVGIRARTMAPMPVAVAGSKETMSAQVARASRAMASRSQT